MSIESRSRQYGTVFDHWHIREFLGSGGKSAVFRLVHSDASSIQSALKVVSLIEKRGSFQQLSNNAQSEYQAAKQACIDRAEREVLLMNSLQGRSNVVDYLDHRFVDWEEDGRFGCDMLIRMELLKDLRSQIDEGHIFSQQEILEIGRQICCSLILCHSKHILHRDIKPENIFYNADGIYKLGDFGISRILSTAPMSKASTSSYTLEYAAPEQLSGNYDIRVDIYSLGLVLYELGNRNHLPFSSSAFISESAVQMRLQGTPLPQPCNTDKPLSDIILKACAVNPSDRYQTAEAFLSALNSLTDYAPVPTPPSVGTGTQKAVPSSGNYGTQYAAPSSTANQPNPGVTPATPVPSPQRQPINSAPSKNRIIPVACIFLAVLTIFLTVAFPKEDPCKDGHSWNIPDCNTPQRCSICGYGDQEPPGHTWLAATCERPEICGFCDATRGEPLPHTWVDATLDHPQYCSVCLLTSGSPLPRIVVTNEIMAHNNMIAAGGRHSVVILSDGTATAVGDNSAGACNVDFWSDLIAVNCGDFYTVGLQSDGTVLATGKNDYGQCNVQNWVNIIAIAAGDMHTVGVTEDGTVLAVGWNEYGQCSVSSLNNAVNANKKIISAAASYTHTVVLYSDGTVGAVGNNQQGQCNVSDWRNIVAVYAGVNYTVGLCSNGTLVAVGDNSDGRSSVHGWSDIAFFSAGDYHVIGITNDGRILTAGENKNGQLNVSGWTNLEAIAAGCQHTVGLTEDGLLLATGENKFGQCNLNGTPRS